MILPLLLSVVSLLRIKSVLGFLKRFLLVEEDTKVLSAFPFLSFSNISSVYRS